MTRRKSYRSRRWAPVQASSSSVFARASGQVLQQIIVARIFTVSLARPQHCRVPLSYADYHDANKKLYQPFGHRDQVRYSALVEQSLAVFQNAESTALLRDCHLPAENKLTMKSISWEIWPILTYSRLQIANSLGSYC